MAFHDENGYSPIKAVTPNDSTDLSGEDFNALYIGVGGDLNIKNQDGQTVLLKNVPEGILPIKVGFVMATSTTAADIIGMV